MGDCERIEFAHKKIRKHKKKCLKDSKDDLGGMMVAMTQKIDVRELIILWALFIFLHTELFADSFLKKISNATNEDGTMKMKGTFIASMIMVVAIMICSIVF